MTTGDIGELCRLCVNRSYYHTNVFQTHSLDGNRLYETLNATCQLNIVEGDGLPNCICMPCACKVSEIEVFKQNSQKGREKLLSFLKNKECGITDTDGRTRCSGGEEIEIEERQTVLKIEQVEELNKGEGVLEEYGDEEESFKAETESPIIAIAHECGITDTDGRTRCSGGEEIEIEERQAVLKIEQVEELNKGEGVLEEYGDEEESFKAETESPIVAIAHECINSEIVRTEDEEMVTEESEDELPHLKLEDSETEEETVDVVSSVPDYLTIGEERDSEVARQNQEHSIVDVQTVKGSLEMWNLERCEIPMNQKESNDKDNEESAVIANGCSDNNEENREECINKETIMYKRRLRNKSSNIDYKLADQYSKPNGKDSRRISTNYSCQKIPLGTKNPGDSIACSVSQKATKVKSVVKKTVGTPVIVSKGSNSLRNKSKSEFHNFLCDTCKKGFPYKSLLGRHVRIHNGVRPFQCSRCSKSFSQKRYLLAHNSVHTVIGKPHVCTECGKSFKHERSLWTHNQLHKDHYPFPCVTCGKLFKSLINFQKHLKIHGIVKPFSCKICNKSFSSKSNLVRHQKTHVINRNKPFSCDICKQSFSSKDQLKLHIYSHDNIKRHKCLICAKSFSLKDSLKRHMSCHSTERLIKCPNCYICFKRMDAVKQHMKFNCKKR